MGEETNQSSEQAEQALRGEIRARVFNILLLSGVSVLAYYLLMGATQDHLRVLEHAHQLNSYAEYQLRTVYEHVGNYPFGAILLPLLYGLADISAFSLFEKREKKISKKVRVAFIACLFSLLAYANYDSEAGQHSIFSFGTPQSEDILAGVVGGVSGAYILAEYSRKKDAPTAQMPRRYTAAHGA